VLCLEEVRQVAVPVGVGRPTTAELNRVHRHGSPRVKSATYD